MLHWAQQEGEEQEADEPPVPAHPMTTGVLQFLGHPSMILRVLVITAGLWLECGAIQTANETTNADVQQQFRRVSRRKLSSVIAGGILLAAYCSTTLLSITQDSSLGQDEMTSLPGVNPTNWFFESGRVSTYPRRQVFQVRGFPS